MAKSALKVISGWRWVHKNIPVAEKLKNKNQAKVMGLECINPGKFSVDFTRYCVNDTVLITGDGHTLPGDVKRFEDWGILHDIYCVNRSMLFFQRPITHWGAVDCEEAVWFSENVNSSILGETPILRHTIGILPSGFDVYWRALNFEDMQGYAKNIWTGNSAYMAVLSVVAMGYKKIVLAGVPLDTGPHWYEPKGTEGPNWVGKVYRQWIDFKQESPDAHKVRSLSGYSAFILGEPEKAWLQKTN